MNVPRSKGLFVTALIFPLLLRVAGAQSLQSTFVPALTFDAVANAIAVQPDGKVIVGIGLGPDWVNANTNLIGATQISLVRLNNDGSLDSTFARVPHSGSPYQRSVSALALLDGGGVVAAGDFYVPGAGPYDGHFGIVKLSGNGVVDQTFHASRGNGQIWGLLPHDGGKILACGARVNSANQAVGRFETNGIVDVGFVASVTDTNNSAVVNAMCLEPDGRILIAGTFSHVNGVYSPNLVRLNTNGTRDSTFSPISFDPSTTLFGIMRQADGKIVATGSFRSVNGEPRTNIARFETNGTLDATFLAGIAGDESDAFYGSIVLPGARILAYGAFDSFAGQTASDLVCLNSDGTRNSSFDAGQIGPANYGGVGSVACDPMGRIIVAGKFLSLNGVTRYNLARLLTNDSPGTLQFVSTNIVVNEDRSATAKFTVARLDGRSGAVSAAFATVDGTALGGQDFIAVTGTVTYANGEFAPKDIIVPVNDDLFLETDEFFTLALSNPTGGLGFSGASVALARIPANDFVGSVDTSFDAVDRVSDISGCPECQGYSSVRALLAQPGGKLLVAGSFGPPGEPSGITRLNVDGSRDTNFHIGSGVAGIVNTIATQPDGKILIGGAFIAVNGVNITNIARLNSDGSLDNSFSNAAAPSREVRGVACQTDGRIIIAGEFEKVAGVRCPYIARLNTNGTVDTNFASPLFELSDAVAFKALAVDASDRIYLSGNLEFENVAGDNGDGFARLLPNSAKDPSFIPAPPTQHKWYGPTCLLLLENGQLLVGGSFGIMRLNGDGSRDESYAPAISFDVATMTFDERGHLLVSEYSDHAAHVRRLNQDGSLDAAFTAIATDTFGTIRALACLADGTVFAGGEFETIGGVARKNLVRLVGGVQPALRVENIGAGQVKLSWPVALSNAVPECALSLPPVWQAMTGTPALAGNFFVLTNVADAAQFYRLRWR